jgi:hypothetical protein
MMQGYMAHITNRGIDSVIKTVLQIEGEEFDVHENFKLEQRREIIRQILGKLSKETLEILSTLIVSDYGTYKGKTFMDAIVDNATNNDSLTGLLKDHWKLNDALRNIKKEQELINFRNSLNDMVDKKAVEEYGATDRMNVMMFMLRAQTFGNDLLGTIRFAMEDKDELIMMKNPYSAFYLLDGLINGETTLGRWGEQSKKTILIFNINEDDITKKMKNWRRKFYSDILSDQGEEDPDVI